MPMQNDRRKPRRARRYRSELDWFGEDPWADPSPQAPGDDWDDWNLDLQAFQEDDPDDADCSDADEWNGDDHDGWGPVRARRRPRHVRS